jgi:hypothetical protein
MPTVDPEQKQVVSPRGLTSADAETRLQQYGPNSVREAKPHLFLGSSMIELRGFATDSGQDRAA